MEWNQLLSTTRRRQSSRLETDARTEFQRDFDRALFCSSVRRLQDKAQVFPLERNDSVRTRLTHSHEVSNVARSLAERVASQLALSGETMAQSIPPIAATVGLLHDLGNPPFGHAGEQAIASWFKRGDATLLQPLNEHEAGTQLRNDLESFEGNAQTIRIVTRLQVLSDDNGLNLTSGTLSALRKYVAQSDSVDKADAARKKTGFFYSERDRIAEIEKHTGCVNRRNPITFLVEAADDIVYGAADLEDGITKRTISWEVFRKEMDARCAVDDAWLGLIDRVERQAKQGSFFEALGKIDAHSRDNVYAQIFRTNILGQMVGELADSFIRHADDMLKGQLTKDLVSTTPSAAVYAAVKGIEQEFVYPHKATLKLEILGRQVIHDLMDIFWEAVREANGDGPAGKGYPQRIWKLLSPSFRLVYSNAFHAAKGNAALVHYARLQLVADYIAGMTDSFACDLHRELYGH